MILFEDTQASRDFAEHNARWVAKLSDGRNVIMNHDRSSGVPPWEALRQLCHTNNIHLTSLYAEFRDNRFFLPENMDGYYFCHSALGGFGMKKTVNHFILGYLKDGEIHCKKVRVPEMIVEGEEIRELKEDDPCLIKKAV